MTEQERKDFLDFLNVPQTRKIMKERILEPSFKYDLEYYKVNKNDSKKNKYGYGYIYTDFALFIEGHHYDRYAYSGFSFDRGGGFFIQGIKINMTVFTRFYKWYFGKNDLHDTASLRPDRDIYSAALNYENRVHEAIDQWILDMETLFIPFHDMVYTGRDFFELRKMQIAKSYAESKVINNNLPSLDLILRDLCLFKIFEPEKAHIIEEYLEKKLAYIKQIKEYTEIVMNRDYYPYVGKLKEANKKDMISSGIFKASDFELTAPASEYFDIKVKERKLDFDYIRDAPEGDILTPIEQFDRKHPGFYG